jgi:salicylate hydroxylase
MIAAQKIGTIAIAGAGIAGLSAAAALKLKGFNAAVFERETYLEPTGAGIQLGPNATCIMEGWELDLLGTSYEPEAIELRNARSGALLNTIPLRRAARARYGAPYVTLLRADLQKALFTRAQELGIPISYGMPIAKAMAQDGGVSIETGGEDLRVAALIGADGLNSSVRRIFRIQPRRYSTHSVAWRAMPPLAAVPAPMRGAIVNWMAGGAHLVHYPVSGGTQMNAVLVIEDIYSQDGEGVGQDFMSYLQDRTRGWGELPRSIVSSTNAWSPWRMYGIEKWPGGGGHIQLIGDAWHAMRPHLASGGVMAIEDGAGLAESLAANPGDIAEGLRRFRAERGPRVWQVAAASAQMGRIYHFPAPFSAVRDLAIKAAPGSMLLARNDWLYGLQHVSRAGKGRLNS